MTTFQKLNLEDGKLSFVVTTDDGVSETCTYMLEGTETEDQLMARVALHIETEKKASVPVAEEAFPVMEVSVSKAGNVTVKARAFAEEVPLEPVA